MEYVNAERQMPALGYQMHVLPAYARVGERSPAIQLQATRVFTDNANVEIVLPALAVLLYVSMALAWYQEMILQTMKMERILVTELFVSQTVIIV